MGINLFCSEVDGDLVLGRIGNRLLEFLGMRLAYARGRGIGSSKTHQVIVDALIEFPLSLSALPKLVVIVLKALPVLAKLFQAVLVDVIDAASTQRTSVIYVIALLPLLIDEMEMSASKGPPQVRISRRTHW